MGQARILCATLLFLGQARSLCKIKILLVWARLESYVIFSYFGPGSNLIEDDLILGQARILCEILFFWARAESHVKDILNLGQARTSSRVEYVLLVNSAHINGYIIIFVQTSSLKFLARN